MEKLHYLDWSAHQVLMKKTEDIKYLMFELRGWAFALPSLSAFGVVRREEVDQVYEMPGMEPPLLGMANYMGNALPIYDFSWNWTGQMRDHALILLGQAPRQLGFWVSGLPKSIKMHEKYERVGIENIQLPEEVRSIASFAWHLRTPQVDHTWPEWVLELTGYDDLAQHFELE